MKNLKFSEFPIEVQEWAHKHQVAQGNPRDAKVFDENIWYGFADGGFYWDKAEEAFKEYKSYSFCHEVLIHQNFDLFFEKYPKKYTWSFCKTPKEKCTMNYCDENGCQNRKRVLVGEPYLKIITKDSDIEMGQKGNDNVVKDAFNAIREKKTSHIVVDEIYEEVSEDMKNAFGRYFQKIVSNTASNVINETTSLIDEMKEQYKDKEDILVILEELREKINS